MDNIKADMSKLEEKQEKDHDVIVGMSTCLNGLDKKVDSIQEGLKAVITMCSTRKDDCRDCFANIKDMAKLEALFEKRLQEAAFTREKMSTEAKHEIEKIKEQIRRDNNDDIVSLENIRKWIDSRLWKFFGIQIMILIAWGAGILAIINHIHK